MHYKEFIATHLGKFVDYDGAYGAQCVDLFRFYCKEVLGISQPRGVGGAREFWINFESDANLYNNFTKIPNTPDFIPIPGDVWIWTNQYGQYGHVAITSYGEQTTSQFEVFSQNDPTGSACVLKNYKYTKIYGVLRPKNQSNLVISNSENTSNTESEDEMKTLEFLGCQSFEEAERKLIDHLGIEGKKCGWGDASRDNTGGYLGSERRKVKSLENQIEDLKNEMSGMTASCTQEYVSELEGQVNSQAKTITELQNQVNQSEQTIIDKNKQIDELKMKLDVAETSFVNKILKLFGR